jgi:hypothetical protein
MMMEIDQSMVGGKAGIAASLRREERQTPEQRRRTT